MQGVAVRIISVKGDQYIQVVTRNRGAVSVLRSFGSATVQENYLRAHLFAGAYQTMRKLLEALNRSESVDRYAFYAVFGAIIGEDLVQKAVLELAPKA